MNKKIILATSCCGKSTAVKNCKLNCADFDSAPYRTKDAGWKNQYVSELIKKTEEYDVVFASYYDEVAAKISRFPGLIVEAPMWYIRELRTDGEHNSAKNMEDKKMSLSSENNSLIDGPLNVPLKKQIEFTDIEVDEWEQISLFDLLGA